MAQKVGLRYSAMLELVDDVVAQMHSRDRWLFLPPTARRFVDVLSLADLALDGIRARLLRLGVVELVSGRGHY
jgi:hypothetical protein